ncbi:MAG: 1-propanol dehydrogenase PduQ [Cellulosilyticaceae bacterium]
MNTFELNTKIKFGQDALDFLQTLGNKKVFIVTDPFMVKSGAIDKITKRLQNAEYTVFSDIVPDPPIELIITGIEAISKFRPEVIVTLGGGSAIDAAKAIMDFSKKILGLPDLQFIAIPTTSGTGSEVTSFSVITDQQKGTKYPLVSDDLLPDVAILDPELVRTVPDFIVADTGMDVLTHALEAYVSTKATDFSDALAEKAVDLVFKYLLRSYRDANDILAREKMHNASCIAGIAFNAASLGINHSMAHVIGGKFHVPHGRTNSILLPHVIEYNANLGTYDNEQIGCAAKKYAEIAKKVGFNASNVRIGVRSLINEIIKLQKEMKMPLHITECKVDSKEFNLAREDLAKRAIQDACTITNPRKPSEQDLVQILHKII